MSISTSYFQSYIDKNISVIPTVMRWDAKKEVFSGKYPGISGWSEFCKELPDDDQVESWKNVSNCTGIAYCTGEASNLACIDIDTEDPVLAKQIAEVLPHTPCRIMGHPKRYGKLLYRITEFPNEMSFSTLQPKKQARRGKEVVADVFLGNAYIVAPPSMHSQNRDGKNTIYYHWYDETMSLEKVGIENLPVLPDDAFYRINQLLQGSTSHSVNLDLGNVDAGESNGRYVAMTNMASALIRRRAPMDDVIYELLDYDKRVFEKDRYFLDRTKGCTHREPLVNAMKFYVDMIAHCNQKSAMELPRPKSSMSPIYLKEWTSARPIEQQKIPQDVFDLSVVPRKWQSIVQDVADTNGVPQEICFYVLLTSLSALIGNKKVICAKHDNKSWEEAHNIWTIYVSPSGTRKTQVLKTLTKFISDIQKDIDKEYGEYVARQDKASMVIGEQIKQIERQIKKEVEISVTEHAGVISESAQNHIDTLQVKSEELKNESKIEDKKQITVKGVTVEKLLEVVAANKSGTLLEYNELSQLTSLFKKKGYEGLRTFLLDSWDGLRSYSYQTKTAGEVFIEKNCTSMYASIQNSMFERELREIAHDINDDGFYQRSFIVVNDAPVAKAIDEAFDINKYSEVAEPFREAYLMGDTLDKITTDHYAYGAFMQFEQEILSLAVSESISALGSFWGKFTGKVVKVAAIIEFINSGSDAKEITLESMNQAIYLMKRQIRHIKNMFPDPHIEHAREVIRLVGVGALKDGVDHDKLVKTYRPIAETKTFNEVFTILHQHNIVDVIARDCKVHYYFNPDIKPDDTEQ